MLKTKRLFITLFVFLSVLLFAGCSLPAVTPDSSNEANLFSDGLLAVLRDGKWGYIDDKGREAIEFMYDGAGAFYDGVALVYLDDQYTLINKRNRTQTDWYDYLERDSETGLIWYLENDKIGLMNTSGKKLTDAIFEDVSIYSWGYSVNASFSHGLARVTKDGERGFINTRGRVEIDFGSLEYNIHRFSHGLSPFYDEETKLYGYIDTKGKVAIEPQFKSANHFNDHEQAVVRTNIDSDHNYAIINTRGRTIIEDCEAIRFTEVGYRVKQDGEFFFINTRGRTHSRNTYESMRNVSFWLDSLFISDGKIIDHEGKVVFEDAEKIDDYFDDNGKFYFVTYNNGEATIYHGRRTYTIEADAIYQIKDGLVTVQRGHTGGLLDLSGKEIIPFTYMQVFITDDGYAIVYSSQEKLGIYDTKGNQIAEAIYDDLEPYMNPY